MTPSQFITTYTGVAVDVDNVAQDAGQCLQLVSLFQEKVQNTPIFFTPYAVDYWTKFSGSPLEQYYDQISVGQPVQPWDLVIFGASSSINSPEAGHADICINPITGGYLGFDSHWVDSTGKVPVDANGYPVAHQVEHSFIDILGYLRLKEVNVDKPDADLVTKYFVGFDIPGPTAAQIAAYTNETLDVLLSDLLQYNFDRRNELQAQINAGTNGTYTTYSGPTLYIKS